MLNSYEIQVLFPLCYVYICGIGECYGIERIRNATELAFKDIGYLAYLRDKGYKVTIKESEITDTNYKYEYDNEYQHTFYEMYFYIDSEKSEKDVLKELKNMFKECKCRIRYFMNTKKVIQR